MCACGQTLLKVFNQSKLTVGQNCQPGINCFVILLSVLAVVAATMSPKSNSFAMAPAEPTRIIVCTP